MRLHHGSQSPLQGDALFDGYGQLPKVLNLVLQEVQNIRVRSELLSLGRRIRGFAVSSFPWVGELEKGVRYDKSYPPGFSVRISSVCPRMRLTLLGTNLEAIPRESLGQLRLLRPKDRKI